MKQRASSHSTNPIPSRLSTVLAILLAVCFCAQIVSAQQLLITLTPYNGTVNGVVNLKAYPGTTTDEATISVSFQDKKFGSPTSTAAVPLSITGPAASWVQEDGGFFPNCVSGGGARQQDPALDNPPFCAIGVYFLVPPGTTPGNYPVTITVSGDYLLFPSNEYAQSIIVNVEVVAPPTGSGTPSLNFVPNLTTFAGGIQRGYNGDNIAATAAELNRPSDIAIDSAGNVFIADTSNDIIRKVDATTGKISTYAGIPQTGGVGNYTGEGGLATQATLQGPGSLVIGGGDLYFTDGNTSVRKIDGTTGIITTYAGPVGYNFGYAGDGGPATSALLYQPDGLALDPNGNLYISEFQTQDVRVVNKATGIITTYAGQNDWNNIATSEVVAPPYPGFSGDGGLATQATLYHPFGLAFRPGNAVAGPGNTLYISDGANHRVRTVDPATGNINTVYGMGAWGYVNTAGADQPISFSSEGTPATTAAIYPESLALDSLGDAYILSTGTLYKVDGTGNIYKYPSAATSTMFGGNGDIENVKVSPQGEVYIAAANNNAIYKITQANSLDFGIVNVGSSSSAQLLTLQNTGSGPLLFNSPTPYTIVGDFTVGNAGTCSFSAALASGSSCTVQITFTPLTPGGQTGSITFNTNDPGAALSGTLTGTGAGPGLTISTTSLTFPDTNTNTTNAAQQITLTAGLNPVNFVGQGIIMVNGNSPFSQTNNCGTTLPADTSCTINVVFDPTNTVTYNRQLSISDDVGGFTQTFISLGGTGKLAPAPVATLTPGFINFPDTPVGTSSLQQTIQLSNTGNADLNIASITLTGPDAASFSKTSTCGTTLAVGAPACSIFITFKPTGTASTTAFLTILDNASGGEQDAFLGGTGTVPAASFNTTSLTFPNTAVGQSSTVQSITIQDTGTGTLNITGVTVGGANPGSYYIISNCPGFVTSGNSCTIYVQLQPIATGTQNATILVTDNASPSSTLITLSGSGTAQPQVINFAALPTQVTSGNAPLALSATGGTSGNPVTFTVTGPGTISHDTLTITGLGTIKVTANQLGNANYLAATPVTQTITVSAFLAPSITNEAATPNNPGSESLGATINPNNASTTWWFAWGLSPTTMTQTSPLHTGLTGTSPIDLGIGALNLQSGATYYYRAVAKSAGGQTLGATQTFVAP